MKRTILAIVFLFTLALTSAAYESSPAQVTDISDRAYEGAIIKLLDSAKQSITISMYTITLASEKRNPISMLLNDLLEARSRGVAVTLYLNTRFKGDKDIRGNLERNPALKKLQDAGCVIHFMAPNKRLHDKLIIVDGRYVVEGSTNWSLSALLDNYESATLIDSPGLARVKLMRLQAMALAGEEAPGALEIKRSLYSDKMPAEIGLPEVLLTDRRYFPKMVTERDERAMDAYLVLSAISAAGGDNEFFVDLESLAVSLGLKADATDSDLRRQAIRWLKDLDENYKLIEVRFFHGKDAHVKLVTLEGPRFRIGSAITLPATDGKLSARVKFMRMIKAYLDARGEDINAISDYELAGRFYASRRMFCDARRDMLKGNIGER
ncbi:MAG: phospholipase D-like domain-containing protein [Candidatus Omnitrophota bacterium]